MSDCGAVSDIHEGHSYATTVEQAAAIALKAGTDLSCGDEYNNLPAAVHDRRVSEDDIDRAVTRLFTARFRLGMFDPPDAVLYTKIPASYNASEANRKLALQAARESIVLLKNDGVLPLRKVRRIAVIGPNADSGDVLLGNYNGIPSQAVTPLQGLIRRFGKETKVTYTPGSGLTETVGFPVPSGALRTDDGQTGVWVEYFCNETGTGKPEILRVEPAVSFDEAEVPAGMKCDSEHSSVRWTGKLVASASGAYYLSASGSNARVWLDGKLVVDDSTPDKPQPATSAVTLAAGHAYPLSVQCAQCDTFRLEWTPPGLVKAAITAAKHADVVIAVVGISPALEGEEMDVSSPGFSGGDRVNLDMPRPQQEILSAVAATGKPLIVVLMNGSALAVNWAQAHADAIVEAWYPGEEGGTAIADVLAGDYSPAGRLPVTFYRSVEQLVGSIMAGRTYRYFRDNPLYAFGYGLSYSTFAYSHLQLQSANISAGEPLQVEATVRNTGSNDSDEVVQLYLDRETTSPAMLFVRSRDFAVCT